MTIPIRRSAMTKVKTLESLPCHPISKKTIWTSGKRSFIKTRHAVIRQYGLHCFHCQRNGAVQILSLPALHLRICDIQPVRLDHHCSSAQSQSSTYHASLTLYRHSRFPRPVATRMFLNERPVEITTFLNTKRLLLR